MRKSKLIELFSGLSKEELTELGKFLRSSYHNKNEKVIKLYEYLKKVHNDIVVKYPFPENIDNNELKVLDKEYVFKKIFKGQKFEAKRILDLMAKLSVLVMDFMVWVEVRDLDLESDFIYLRTLKKRGLDRQFFQIANAIGKKIQKMPYRDAYYYNAQMRLNKMIYEHPSTGKLKSEILSLKETVVNLDHYYLYNRLKYNCEMLNRGKILGQEYEEENLDKILPLLPENTSPIFEILTRSAQTVRKVNDENYYRLKEIFFENLSQIQPIERNDLFIYLTNYASHRIHQGAGIEFLREVFELYKLGLQERLVIPNNRIDESIFLNIIDLSCRLDEYDWARNFIEDFKQYLNPNSRESTRKLGLAKIYFSEDNYESTLELLIKVEFKNVYYSLVAKGLMLRSYYELSGYDVLFFDFCEAFSKFLHRNKIISEDYKKAYLNLIRFSKLLYKAKTTQKLTKPQLLEEYKNIQNMASRKWISQKLDSIK
ncbi:MAG: hypothetical protein AAF502_11170 [Bacteroidota bacterium]